MATSHFYRDRWLDLDPKKLCQYERMFQWNPASQVFYEPADIGPGQVVGELGCGPGHTAVELAQRVGSTGHVHALDINEAFLERARNRAAAAGLDGRITAHKCDGNTLPLGNESLDRLTTRNTLIYVNEPQQTIAECWRVLKPGGVFHAIEGDWPMMLVEPVPSRDWLAVVTAASHACRTPDIGRKLYGHASAVGFSDIDVQLITRPDTSGRLLGMVKNMAGYAKVSGNLSDAVIDDVIAAVEQALDAGTYLALAPQFVVTARK